MALLSTHNLMCIKRDRVLFEDLALSLHEKQILHLKGPNGAGKTSLLRILAGLALPTEGEVRYQQNTLSTITEKYCCETLYIGHKSGLNNTLSGVENTCFWAFQQGIAISPEEATSQLTEMGLVGLEDLPIAFLSAGQQRRVALLRLWLKTKAKIWFLDEPFTALDKQGIAKIEKKLFEHAEAGGCAVVTSHQELSAHPLKREQHLEYRF